MTKAELLANIKTNMKISVTSFDTVLNQMIDECIKDIRESMDVDSLEAMTDVELLGDVAVCGTIRTYIRARFGEPSDMAGYELAYQTQLAKLAVRYNATNFVEAD